MLEISKIKTLMESEKIVIKIINFLTLISIFYLLYYYRQGGIKDAGLTETTIRDLGPYIDGGIKILHGENPYIPISTRSGTFGALPLTILSLIIPDNFKTFIFQMINLMGVIYFLVITFANKSKIIKSLAILLLIWMSPVREMLVTNQVTGIVLGLLAIGIRAHKEKTKKIKNIRFSNLITALAFGISVDLKPHITIAFVVIYLLNNRDFKAIRDCLVLWLTIHIFIDFTQWRILELDYLKFILGLAKTAQKNELGDSVAFWPLLSSVKTLQITDISIAIIATLFCSAVILSLRKQRNPAIILSLLIPSFSIYFHFYDAIAIGVLVLFYSIETRSYIVSFLTLSFFWIPKEFLRPSNIVMVILLTALFCKVVYVGKNNSLRKIIESILGLILAFIVHIFNLNMNSSNYSEQSIAVTECLIFAIFLFLINEYFSKYRLKLQERSILF